MHIVGRIHRFLNALAQKPRRRCASYVRMPFSTARGQLHLLPRKAKRQLLVVEAQQMQSRRVRVVDVPPAAHGLVTMLIGVP